MLRDSLITLITRVVLFILSSLTAILTARLLQAEGRGIYVLLTNYASLMLLGGNLGISVANIYYGSQRRHDPSPLVWNSIITGLLLGGLLIGAGYLGFLVAYPLFANISAHLIWLSLATLPLLLVWQFLVHLILGLQRIVAYNVLSSAQGVMLAVLLLVLLPWAPRVETAFAATILASLVAAVLSVAYLFRQGFIVSTPQLDLPLLKKSVAFGIKSQIGNILQFLTYRFDLFLINFFLDSQAVGIYSIAVVLAESLWYVTNSIAVILFPQVSAATSTRMAAEQLTVKLTRMGLASTVGLAASLAVAAPLGIPLLFGKEFLGAVPALLWLLPGVVVFSMTNILASYIVGRGYPQYNAVVSAISFTVTLGLDLLLIPLWGIVGAAIATTVAYLAATMVILYFFRKLASTPFSTLLIPCKEDYKSLLAQVSSFKQALRKKTR
jgi:stage V sporulation protein B